MCRLVRDSWVCASRMYAWDSKFVNLLSFILLIFFRNCIIRVLFLVFEVFLCFLALLQSYEKANKIKMPKITFQRQQFFLRIT